MIPFQGARILDCIFLREKLLARGSPEEKPIHLERYHIELDSCIAGADNAPGCDAGDRPFHYEIGRSQHLCKAVEVNHFLTEDRFPP